MKKLTVFIFCCILNFHCGGQPSFKWLLGRWKLEEKPAFEIWKLNADSTLAGKSFRISGSDTIVTETITLVRINNDYYYIPDVPENQHPVNFKITSHTPSSFVAENPSHDFPKMIRYTIVRKDDQEFIDASIEGNGKVIYYRFKKTE